MKIKLFSILLSVFILQCASAQKSFKTPDVSYEGLKVEHIDFAGATLTVFLGIDNQNPSGLKVASMEHTMFMEEDEIFHTTTEKNFHIKPREKTVVEIPLTISFKGFKKGIAYIIENGSLPYRLNSIITFDSILGKIPVKIKKEGVFEFPPPPDISVENVKLAGMSIKTIELVFYLLLENNDEVNLKIKEMRYNIYLNNTPISDGSVDASQDSLNSGELHLKIPVQIQMMNLKRSIIQTIRSGKVDYEMTFYLNMKSQYGDYVMPIEKKGMAELY